MSQIEDIRFKQADHERRLSRLEKFLAPIIDEQEKMQAAEGAENLLDDVQAEPPTSPGDPTLVTLTPQDPGNTNPDGGMAVVVDDNGQQPSVSNEVKEEPKNEAN